MTVDQPTSSPIRRAARIPAYMAARYERGGLFSDGIVRDLSTLGAFIATRHVDAPGSEGSVTLRSPTHRFPFKVPCRVAHSQRVDRTGIGLEFLDSPDVGVEHYCSDFHRFPRVVAVDDEARILRLLERLLESSGAKLIGIDQPITAVDVIVELAPAVVVLDIEMPRISGIELAEQLRANPATAEIPLIFLSSRDPATVPAPLQDVPFVNKGGATMAVVELVRNAIAS